MILNYTTHPPFNYPELVTRVWRLGERVHSRYGDTHELLGVTTQTWTTLLPHRTGYNPAIGFMELSQLIAGTYDPDAIFTVAPNTQRHLFNAKMAYGPRARAQVAGVLEELEKNPSTRRAVLMIARPDDSPTPGPELDMPCTTTIQFIHRLDYLHCHVYMRSWDLLKGLPYDLIMFGGLAQAIAGSLSYHPTPGLLTVHAGSAHVYDRDVAAARLPVASNPWQVYTLTVDRGWGGVVNDAAHAITWADRWEGRCPRYITRGPVLEDQGEDPGDQYIPRETTQGTAPRQSSFLGDYEAGERNAPAFWKEADSGQ